MVYTSSASIPVNTLSELYVNLVYCREKSESIDIFSRMENQPSSLFRDSFHLYLFLPHLSSLEIEIETDECRSPGKWELEAHLGGSFSHHL